MLGVVALDGCAFLLPCALGVEAGLFQAVRDPRVLALILAVHHGQRSEFVRWVAGCGFSSGYLRQRVQGGYDRAR